MTTETFETDEQYQRWREDHPQGFVLNTTRSASPAYMVLHRTSCTYISDPLHEKAPGGFTERDYLKVGADDIESLRDWAATHGREDRSFSSECSRCKPTMTHT
jgi:hypothetical protein